MIKILRQIAHIRFAPVVGILFGVIFAILVLMTPQWLFERGVGLSGLPNYVPAAQPPLGETARILVAVFGGLAVMSGLWAVITPISRIIKSRAPAKPRGQRIAPVQSHADARDEAPPRRFRREPIFAERDLGAPFMSDAAIAEPMTAPEPIAIAVEAPPTTTTPEQPIERVAAPLAPRPPRRFARPAVAPAPETIGALMTRLDAALERRSAQGVTGMPRTAGDITSLRQALATLS